MLEADLVRKWLTLLHKLGAWAERHAAYDVISQRGLERLGMPDIEVCLSGRYMAIEAKRGRREWVTWMHDKSKQAPEQKRCILEIREAGGVAFCTYRTEDIELAAMMILNNASSREINDLIDERLNAVLSVRPVRRSIRKPKRQSPSTITKRTTLGNSQRKAFL